MVYVLRYDDRWLGRRDLGEVEVELACDGDSHVDCPPYACLREYIQVERIESSQNERSAGWVAEVEGRGTEPCGGPKKAQCIRHKRCR